MPLIDASANEDRANLLSVFASTKAQDTDLTTTAKEARDRKAHEEYRRLLYVAATRAEDELYICGAESGKNKNPRAKETRIKTWHALAEDAMDALGERVAKGDLPFWSDSDAVIRSLSCEQTEPPKQDEAKGKVTPAAPPGWLYKPADKELAPDILAPSRLHGESDADIADIPPDATSAYPPTGSDDPYFRGRIIHRLLELLPDIPDSEREKTADDLLYHLAPQTPPDERARWGAETLQILNDQAFGDVFTSGSRAEVSIGGLLPGDPGKRKVSGEIDRLVISEDRILIVDYKTNRPPPDNVANADPAYITQLAVYRALIQEIYPDRQVDCALLWTFAPKLMPVPDSMLDHAFARVIKAG